MPGSSSCSGAESAWGLPPEHCQAPQQWSSQHWLHQGCSEGPAHQLCQWAPSLGEGGPEGRVRLGRMLAVPKSGSGRSSDPSINPVSSSQTTSINMRLKIHPQGMLMTPAVSCRSLLGPLHGYSRTVLSEPQVATMGPL